MASPLIKVCHFTSVHQHSDVRIFLKECVSLSKNGFDVTLIAPNSKSQVISGVKIIGVESMGSSRFHRIFKITKKIYREALRINADIYHFHDPELLPYGLKLVKAGKKVIYDVHEDVPQQILGKYWINKYFRSVVSYLFKVYENYVAKRLSYIIAATPHIRERFLKINSKSIDICNYPIIDENKRPANWEDKADEICYVGGITEIRGVKEIISALENTTVKINLAGDYSPANLRDELKKLKGWENVIEYGFVNREKIAEILNRSKAGMVTLHPLDNYMDSLPVKMFEYMLAGIPVIASDFPLWKNILTENKCGICIDPLNPSEIAEAIQLILGDNAKAFEMGMNGRKAVMEKFNWKQEEKKLLETYSTFK